MLGRINVVSIKKSGSFMSDGSHTIVLVRLYSGGVPLKGVHN